MESQLYKSIFADGRAEGEARGEARGKAEGEAQAHAGTIYKRLVRWLGSVDVSVRQHLATFRKQSILEAWCDEAVELKDADSAQKLLVRILQTPAPASSDDSSRAA